MSDAGSRPPSTSLAGMFEALRSDAGLQRRVDEMGGCLLAYHRFLAESSARLKGQSRQARAAVEAVERTLKDPSLDEAPGSAQTTPWPEWPSAGGSSDAGVVVSASPPPASLRPEALQAAIDAEQTEMQEQLKTMLTASGGLLGACAGLRSELAASRAALRRARDQEASVANRMEEVAAEAAKDKQFLLTVVNTLKDQLGEERAERARMRSALDASGATQQKTLDALQAAHDAALRPHARAADITRNARKACQALHGRLDAFCAKWVPHGAEPREACDPGGTQAGGGRACSGPRVSGAARRLMSIRSFFRDVSRARAHMLRSTHGGPRQSLRRTRGLAACGAQRTRD